MPLRKIWSLHPFEHLTNLHPQLGEESRYPFKMSLMRRIGRGTNSRDQCAFHDDMGHKTEDYFTLKDAIEEVVRNGELIEFINQGGS